MALASGHVVGELEESALAGGVGSGLQVPDASSVSEPDAAELLGSRVALFEASGDHEASAQVGHAGEVREHVAVPRLETDLRRVTWVPHVDGVDEADQATLVAHQERVRAGTTAEETDAA